LDVSRDRPRAIHAVDHNASVGPNGQRFARARFASPGDRGWRASHGRAHPGGCRFAL
jgi:hypothetical protein